MEMFCPHSLLTRGASAPTLCHSSRATEYYLPWAPLSFSFFNVILSLCPLKGLTSAQTDILCSGREGAIEGGEEGEMSHHRVSGNVADKHFKLIGNVSFLPLLYFTLLCSTLLRSTLLYSTVRAINRVFSSQLVLRSSMTTWLLLKAVPSRRKTHYEIKVRRNTWSKSQRYTSTCWLINQNLFVLLFRFHL